MHQVLPITCHRMYLLQISCTSIFLLLCIIVLATRQRISGTLAAELQASRLARHARQHVDPEEAFLMDDAVVQTRMMILVRQGAILPGQRCWSSNGITVGCPKSLTVYLVGSRPGVDRL